MITRNLVFPAFRTIWKNKLRINSDKKRSTKSRKKTIYGLWFRQISLQSWGR